jgi:DnaK suppressor protein
MKTSLENFFVGWPKRIDGSQKEQETPGLKGGRMMDKPDLARRRRMLLDRRRQALERVGMLESEWRALAEPGIELEEEAQKAHESTVLDLIEERARRQIEEIDLALQNMSLGKYGVCERCKRPISAKRLKVIPEARLCRKCALRYERDEIEPANVADNIACTEAPEGYRNLSDEELHDLIMQHLRDDGRIGLEELDVTCRNGEIHLDGTVPSETEHQIVLQILTDFICSSAIIDHLRTNEWLFEREDRTPNRLSAPTVEEVLLYDLEDLSANEMIQSEEDETLYGFSL